MICIGCITADKPSSSANKLPLMSRGREQCAVLSCAPFKQALKTLIQTSSVLSRHQLRLCCVHLQTDTKASSHTCIPQCLVLSSASVQSYCCSHSLPDEQVHKFTPCSASLFTSPYMWLQGLLVPTPHSLQQSAERGKRGGRKKEQVGTFFRGPVIFLSDQPGAVGLQIKSVPKKKRRQQNTDKSFAFQPPPGKVPSSGKAGNFPWPTYSLSRLYLSAGSVVGFINEILTAVFSTHVSDCSARASFSITMSSRQIWQVELRRQHIEVN